MNQFSSDRYRTKISVLAAVVMLAAVCMVPMAASESDAASQRSYTVNLAKGTEWQTDYTYTATLSPELSVVVGDSEVIAGMTGWSSPTTGSTQVSAGDANSVRITAYLDTSNHKVKATIKVGENYSSANAYVGLKLVTKNPSQTAVTAFKVNVLDPALNGYIGGSYHVDDLVGMTPTLTIGNGYSYKSVTYSISSGSNGKTLEQNTGLSIDTTNGKISGKVTHFTNSVVNYTVTARTVYDSGYPGYVDITANLSLGTYVPSTSVDTQFNAVKGVTDIVVAGPTTDGITHKLTSATYSIDGGDKKQITIGTPFNGITLDSAGAITGKATVSGIYTVKQYFNVEETGKLVIRDVTLRVEDKVTVSIQDSTVVTYVGGASAGTAVTTANHTEDRQVNGTWTFTENNTGFNINAYTGAITFAKKPAAGVYTLTAKYTSTLIPTNFATVQVKVYVDPDLVLNCSDADKVLYAATDSSSLDNGQDSAVMSQTASLVAGVKKVSYALSSTTLDVPGDVSIDSSGKITISGTIDASKVGTHTVTVTCTDSAVPANTASMDITVTVVAAMSTGEPSVGKITSS